jgi:hypothetical protein
MRTKIAALGLCLATLGGCGDDDVRGYCEDGHCACSGDACVCPSTGDCAIECEEDCELTCAGSGDCSFGCGEGCLAECTNSGNCAVAIGEQASARCLGAGDCDVRCSGACSVACLGSGDCDLTCLGDAPGPMQCRDATHACGGCP